MNIKKVWTWEFKNASINLCFGNAKISGVPSIEMAERFIELANIKKINDADVLLNNNGTISLVGSVIIEALINELKGFN